MQVDVITKRNIKPFFEATMKSTPERITGNSTMDLGTLGTINNLSAVNLLCDFLALLDVKQKLLSTYWYFLEQNGRKSVQAVLYGLLFISGESIKKSTSASVTFTK